MLVLLFFLATIIFVVGVVALLRARKVLRAANELALQSSKEYRHTEESRYEAGRNLQEAKSERRRAEDSQRTAGQYLQDAQLGEQADIEVRQQAKQLRDEATNQLEQAKAEHNRAENVQRVAEQLLRDAQVERTGALENREQAKQLQDECIELAEQARIDRIKSEEAQRIAEQSLQNAHRQGQEAADRLEQVGIELQKAEVERQSATEERQKAEEVRKDTSRILEQVQEERRQAEFKLHDLEEKLAEARSVLEIAQGASHRAEQIYLENSLQRADDDQTAAAEEIQKPLLARPPQRSEPDQRDTLPVPTRVQSLKPEIVCWQIEREWVLGIELPKEITDDNYIQVLQRQHPLEKEYSRDNCWRLRQVFGEIEVFVGGQEFCRFSVGEQNKGYLLFKLTGETQKQGRLVQEPSSGAYFFIVPATWKPDGATFPENVSLHSYVGYYRVFAKDEQTKLSFEIPGKVPIIIQAKANRFALIGNNLNDVNEYLGSLFGGELPSICGLSDEAWNNISSIVVGEEGRGKGEWRTSFEPVIEGTDVRLPEEEFADRQGGWYFIRFYNDENRLVESLDFRFVRGLHSIEINPLMPLPSDTGYSTGVVEFSHGNSCRIHPATELERELSSEFSERGTTVLIRAHRRWDKTKWLVVPQNGEDQQQVEVTVQIERIWWAIGEEKKEPTEWTDRPVLLSRNDFRATSEKILWLSLPTPRRADQVLLGFAQAEYRPYQARTAGNTIAIPLWHFDGSPVLNHPGQLTLEMKFISQEQVFVQPLCRVTIQMRCPHCDFGTLIEIDLLKHIETVHLDKFFRALTNQEYHDDVDSSHPEHVTRCGYLPCNFYATSRDGNRTSIVRDHIRNRPEHGGCKYVKEEEGLRRVLCREVTDLREIEELFEIKLQEARKCSSCGTIFKDATSDIMIKHLLENHRNRLSVLR